MGFDYFYGAQADQFSFIRIPRIMITNKKFAGLSIPAKMLYAILLDRMSMSSKNGWFDEKNRVFIIYQVGEIAEDLNFTKKKAMELLAELETFGLLEKKRRGHGLPNILYLKSFMTGVDSAGRFQNGTSYGNRTRARNSSSGTSATTALTAGDDAASMYQDAQNVVRSDENRTSQSEQDQVRGDENGTSQQEQALTRGAEYRTSQPDYALARGDENGTSQGETLVRGAVFGTQEVPDSGLQEVPDSAPLKNKTYMNQTYESQKESHRILSGKKAGQTGCDEMGCDEMGCDEMTTIEAYREIIAENIEKDILLFDYPYDSELIEGIADLMLEVVVSKNETTIIASNSYPTELVRSRFLKLNCEHIRYVIDCLRSNTTKVKNIKKYLLAALFNAPLTISGYYQAEVNHDMPQLAVKRHAV